MGLTTEQREQKKLEKEAKLRNELEAKLRAEIETEIRAEIENEKSEECQAATSTTIPKSSTRKLKKLPLDTIVPVICNTPGGAIYKSKRLGGYIVEWDDIGGIEYMELSELQSMRNTDRRFFEDSWVVVEEAEDSDGNFYSPKEIYEFLRVGKYFEKIYTPDTIEDIFKKSPVEVIRDVTPLSRGMKDTIATFAKIKFDDKTLDLNLVDSLEEALGVQLSI